MHNTNHSAHSNDMAVNWLQFKELTQYSAAAAHGKCQSVLYVRCDDVGAQARCAFVPGRIFYRCFAICGMAYNNQNKYLCIHRTIGKLFASRLKSGTFLSGE